MTKPREGRSTWLNANVVAMGATSLLSDLGHEMATAVLPAFMASLGLGPATLGVIEGVADGVSSFVKLGAGRLSDRVRNRKRIGTVGYALTGLNKALFALAHGWPLILVARVGAWFGRGIRGPVRDAMLAASVPPESVGRAFGFHRAGDTLGAVLGPLAALACLWALGATEGTYRTIFLLTLVPGVASALVFGLSVREPLPDRRLDETPGLGVAAWPRRYRRFLGAVLLFGVSDFAPTLLILRATEAMAGRFGWAEATSLAVGLYTLRNVVYAAASYPVGALSDRVDRMRLLAVGYVLQTLVAIGAGWLDSGPWPLGLASLGVFALSGIVVAVQDSLEAAIVADLLPAETHGGGYGALAAVNGVGDLASSALIGAVWTLGSPRLAFGLSAALALAGAVSVARLSPRRVS
jgi:MFS family permease